MSVLVSLRMPLMTLQSICLWLPQVSNTKGRIVVSQGGEPVMVPNVEAILEDFAILGEGLVQAVEARSERWTV